MESVIIPAPDTIPVHWMWFQILLILTFVLHLVFMNLVLGGSLLTVWDVVRGKKVSTETHNLPTLLALTINLGIPPLLFVQVLFGHFFYSSSVLMAIYWILVIPVLILAYYGSYIFCKTMEKKPILGKTALMISTLFMLYIAFMFVNNSTLAIQPERWAGYFSEPGGKLLNLSDGSIYPRYLHFIIAAVAIAALGKAVWAKFFSKEDADSKQQKVKQNLKIFGWATLLQFVLGTWFWLALPKNVTMAFMGENIVATIFMVIAILSAILIVYFSFKGKLVHALINGVFQIVVMSIVREFSRSSYLTELFKPSQLENVNQISPLVVFLVIFIIGIFTLYFMYQLTFTFKSPQS